MSLTLDKVLISLKYGMPFCDVIYRSYKLSNLVQFVWLKLIGIFWCSIVSLNYCKECLNMATFKISVVLLIKS